MVSVLEFFQLCCWEECLDSASELISQVQLGSARGVWKSVSGHSSIPRHRAFVKLWHRLSDWIGGQGTKAPREKHPSRHYKSIAMGVMDELWRDSSTQPSLDDDHQAITASYPHTTTSLCEHSTILPFAGKSRRPHSMAHP